jgi:glycosyltransferase involved in cell wall biosynthesis
MLSIIMPVYNGEKYLEETLNSILSQQFKNYELLIYNDASTDKTQKILEYYKKKDERITLYRGSKNILQPNAMNFLINKTKNEYIALHDADDVSMPNKFFLQMNYLIKNSDIGLLGTFAEIIDEKSNIIRKISYPYKHDQIKKEIAINNCFAQSSVIFKKKIYRKVGKFNALFNPAQDYDMWTRMINLTKVENLPEYLLRYREHEQSSSSINKANSIIKSLFISQNYKYLKKGKDILKKNRLLSIDESSLLKFFKLSKLKIEFEIKFAELAASYKKKNLVKFLYNFYKLFKLNYKLLFLKIIHYIQKSL